MVMYPRSLTFASVPVSSSAPEGTGHDRNVTKANATRSCLRTKILRCRRLRPAAMLRDIEEFYKRQLEEREPKDPPLALPAMGVPGAPVDTGEAAEIGRNWPAGLPLMHGDGVL